MSSAAHALRALLAGRVSAPADWREFEETAKSNVVLLRCHDAFAAADVPMPDAFRAAAELERDRVRDAVALLAQLADICREMGIPHLFPKAFQHYPDMGHDIDLFIDDASARVDAAIRDSLAGSRLPGSFANWVSGKTSYAVAGRRSPIEIHHGRLGQLGEQARLARFVLKRASPRMVAGGEFSVPSDEDQLLIQSVQRVYGHRNLRIADACASITLIGTGLDWPYIWSTARDCGISEGLRYYLGCLEHISREVLGRGLGLDSALIESRALLFHGVFRIPLEDVTRLFWLQLRSADCATAARLSALPVCAGIAGLRLIGRRLLA